MFLQFKTAILIFDAFQAKPFPKILRIFKNDCQLSLRQPILLLVCGFPINAA
jgi:hypothetical protein